MPIYEETSGTSPLDIYENEGISYLLLETGGYLLLVTGGKLILASNNRNYDILYEETSS
jgi:hypothetical protein